MKEYDIDLFKINLYKKYDYKLSKDFFNLYENNPITKGEIIVKLIISEDSKKIGGLQAIDMFVWGAHRKYEHKDEEWIKIFKKKIQYDNMYLKENKKLNVINDYVIQI